jgi:hypothetical protein
VVRLWIESDEPSRVRKCHVSHLDEQVMSEVEARELIARKDEYSRSVLERTTGADFGLDYDRFDVVLTNSDLIPEATPEAAARGVKIFDPVVVACVRYALGEDVGRPQDERILVLRKLG